MNNLKVGILASTFALAVCGGIVVSGCRNHKTDNENFAGDTKEIEQENLRNNNIMIKLYEAKVKDDSIALFDALKAINGIDFKEKIEKYEKSKDKLEILKKFNEENGKEQQISFPVIKIESFIQYNNLKNSHDYYFAETDSGTYACRNFNHAAVVEDGETKYWLWSENK